MFIVRSLWTGLTGLPGYTNMAFNSTLGGQPSAELVTAAQGAVHSFMSDLQNFIPSPCEIQVEQSSRVIDPVTGDLTGIVAAASPQPVVHSNASSAGYPGGVGARVDWKTGLISGGRVLAGSTFIVPLIVTSYFNGMLTTATQVALQADAQRLISDSATAGASLGIWGRPRKSYTNRKGVVLPARAGSFAIVLSSSVPPTNALLKSRRD